MIRKSNNPRQTLIAAIGEHVQAFQDATDEIDEAVAQRLRLNRTDLRCLGVVSRAGPTTASALAAAAGLTRGAMTTALDRLEQSGFVTRVWSQEDRRSVRVELTANAYREIGVLYAPLGRDGAALLEKYNVAELAAVLRYLEDGERLQRAHAHRIRALDTKGTKPTRVTRI